MILCIYLCVAKYKLQMQLWKSLFFLLGITACLYSCNADENLSTEMNESTNVFYEGLPMGCDSAKVIPLTDELSSFITSLDNEKEDTPSLILFYYGRDKVLVKSNDYQTKAIKLYAEGQVSQELEIFKKVNYGKR